MMSWCIDPLVFREFLQREHIDSLTPVLSQDGPSAHQWISTPLYHLFIPKIVELPQHGVSSSVSHDQHSSTSRQTFSRSSSRQIPPLRRVIPIRLRRSIRHPLTIFIQRSPRRISLLKFLLSFPLHVLLV
jgi:hypothetical protein